MENNDTPQILDAAGRKMNKRAMLVECIELMVFHGYDIRELVGVSLRSINFEWVAKTILELRNVED